LDSIVGHHETVIDRLAQGKLSEGDILLEETSGVENATKARDYNG
jgi:hypothetical protein